MDKPKLNKRSRCHQGTFTPKHPEKYVGKYPIIYRSEWERKFMSYCDEHPDIIKWYSEIEIKYLYSLDNKYHRYYVDFYIETIDNNKKLIEIKPYKETIPPVAPKVKNKKAQSRFLSETISWIKNQDKWNAARELCKKNKMEFLILDEYKLGIKKR